MRHAHRITAVLALTLMLTACPQERPPADAPGESTDSAATAPSNQAPTSDMATTGSDNAAPQGKRAAGEENAPLQAWRGFGNEPFWEARVDGDTLTFSTPDIPDGRTMKGRRVPSLVGYVFIGQDDGKDFNLGLTPADCSDGMSDNRYTFRATFSYGGTTYTGCGEAAK